MCVFLCFGLCFIAVCYACLSRFTLVATHCLVVLGLSGCCSCLVGGRFVVVAFVWRLVVWVVLFGVYVFVVCGSNWLLPVVFCLVEDCLLFICVLVVWWFGLGAAMLAAGLGAFAWWVMVLLGARLGGFSLGWVRGGCWTYLWLLFYC